MLLVVPVASKVAWFQCGNDCCLQYLVRQQISSSCSAMLPSYTMPLCLQAIYRNGSVYALASAAETQARHVKFLVNAAVERPLYLKHGEA